MPALPILEIHENSFSINVPNFNSVLDQAPDVPIVLISINGIMREGKSYIHSYFIRYLKLKGASKWFDSVLDERETFSWRSGSVRETVGINIWSEPFMTKSDGRDVAVLLLDCQGLFDPKTTYAQNAAIYAFSSLLSSVMIYNVRNKIEEDLLQKILLFTNYTDSIASTDPEYQDTKPYFMFLLRDFEFIQEFDFGFHNKYSFPKKELENPGNYYEKIFTNTQKIHDKNIAVRAAIQNSYKDIGMFLMPRPGTKFIRDSKKNPPTQEFQDVLKGLVTHILSNLVTKRIGKEEVTGKIFKTQVKLWADLCQNSEFPVAETAAEMSSRLENDMAVTMAIETFKMKYSTILKGEKAGMEDDELHKTYQPLLEEAIEVYKSSRSLGEEDVIEKYVTKLTETCKKHFKEHCIVYNKLVREIKQEKLSHEEELKKRRDADASLEKWQMAVRVVELGIEAINMIVSATREKKKKSRQERQVGPGNGLSGSAPPEPGVAGLLTGAANGSASPVPVVTGLLTGVVSRAVSRAVTDSVLSEPGLPGLLTGTVFRPVNKD